MRSTRDLTTNGQLCPRGGATPPLTGRDDRRNARATPPSWDEPRRPELELEVVDLNGPIRRVEDARNDNRRGLDWNSSDRDLEPSFPRFESRPIPPRRG